MVKLTINFENELCVERFMSWLENQGQDNYWDFLKNTEDSYGDLTEPTAVVNFDYDYDDFIVNTEAGFIEIQTDLEDFGEFEEEDDE